MYGKQISRFNGLSKKTIEALRRKIEDKNYIDTALEKLADGLTDQIIKSKTLDK
jgi:DNA-binding CsgD family transcriptional regulator